MSDTDQIDDTTTEPTVEAPVEQPTEPVVDDKAAAKPAAKTDKPSASVPARGAMVATAMAAVPATGVSGALLYGNFGPMGVAAAGGVAAVAGGVALAVRKKKAADAAKAGAPKGALPPHPLGGLGGLRQRMKEKAAGRREAMAARRSARQSPGTSGGAAGAGGRRAAGMAARVRSAMGSTPGGRVAAGAAGRKPAAAAGQNRTGRSATGRMPVGGRSGTGQAASGRQAAGRRAAAGRGTPARGGARSAAHGSTSRGHAAHGGGRTAGAHRYTNPATGRPMTTRQVAKAMRQQQRAQRIVANNGGRPTQAARWAWRHRRVAGTAARFAGRAAGVAAIGLMGAGFLAAAVPVAAVAAVSLGAFRVARHPAMRRLCRRGVVGVRYRSIMAGRWLRALWRRWRKTTGQPLVGDLIDSAPKVSTSQPQQDVVDAEIVDTPPTQPVRPAPAAVHAAHPYTRRQGALSNRPEPTPVPQETNMSGIFDTLTETLHGLPGLSLGPGEGGGHDVERWANSLAAFLSAMAGKVSSDSSTICERLPMESSSREDMSNLSTAMIGLAGQVYEHVEQWKNDTSWQYTDNNA